MHKTLIIAEAGVNHNGDMEVAKKLIDVAAEAGADIVKFQSFKLDKLVSKNAKKADYQQKNTGDKESSQYEMLKKLSITVESAKSLKSYCTSKGIQFLSSPFDTDSIDELILENLVDRFKVPSGEIINLQYLRKLGSNNLPVILSTGMTKMNEIAEAIDVLLQGGILQRKDITVLHCNTDYPTSMEDVNLKAMRTIKEAFKVQVGYSDHTLGIEVPIAAVALGATVIEKHFTLDKTMEGPDHKASLEPKELKAMVSAIRNIEKAMGSGIKEPSPSERKNISIARKSIHTSRLIQAGEILTEEHIVTRRPANGISPMDIDIVIGRKVNKDLKEDSALNWSDFN